MKKILELATHRVAVTVLLMLFQLFVLYNAFMSLGDYLVYFYVGCYGMVAGVFLHIINGKHNPAYKLAWIIPLMLFPIFGSLFYLLFGQVVFTPKQKRRHNAVLDKLRATMEESPVLEQLEEQDPHAASQSRYIRQSSLVPAYGNTETQYFPLGEDMFQSMLEELEKAEKYIFMEYFIIEEGKMWGGLLEVLERKARQGIDVRVMYDDVGCLFTLPSRYYRQLEAKGIKACAFSPFVPVLSSRFNNRDHRKIMVIDGKVGYTGGVNLADEYINAYQKYGHWKDTGMLLRGEGAWGLATLFLSMWEVAYGEEEPSYEAYKPDYSLLGCRTEGVVQPFGDSPLDWELTGETVYLNIINKAKRYVYINTPYLIIDNELVTALCSAAKSGIDVRITTPHIADKRAVHSVTRAYYAQLMESGVRIFEYTPGFMHAKSFVSDDEYAVIGTINLDYRSLYLHYECGVWLYKTNSIPDMRDDYLEVLGQCREVTPELSHKAPPLKRLIRSVLRVFAPLM